MSRGGSRGGLGSAPAPLWCLCPGHVWDNGLGPDVRALEAVQTAMLIRVVTAGGRLSEAAVRAAAYHGGPADHIDVQLLLDVRWLEPLSADVDYLATPYAPQEEDPGTEIFLQELDERLDTFREMCAESAATNTARRVLGMPDEAIAKAAQGADLLVLPHPNGASAELRKAIEGCVAAPPVPLMLVAFDRQIQAATVHLERPLVGMEDAHALLSAVLGGKVNRVSLGPGIPVEPFRSLAPLVEQVAPAEDWVADGDMDPEELHVVLNAARAKGLFAVRSTLRRRLSPQRNLLLVPATPS